MNTVFWGKCQRKRKRVPNLLKERDKAIKEARSTIQHLREQNGRLATRYYDLLLITSHDTYTELWQRIEALPRNEARTALLRILSGQPAKAKGNEQ
jgi:hypothetical protein